ncbi:MAG: glycosyltransferase family 2 protein [Planctomycetota bacterium]
MANARGEIVVFLNDDAVPATDLLTRHLRAQAESTLPRAVIGTFGLLPRHRTDSLAEYVERTTTLFAQNAMQAGVHYAGLSLCTGNVSVKRAHVVEVGGFDAGIPHAGGEDSEFGLRLERALGLRVVFDPTCRCGHDHALDVRSLARRKRAVGWSIHRIQSRHGDLGLVPGHAWPTGEAEAAALGAALAAERANVDALIESVDRVCRSEREKRTGAVSLHGLVPHLRRIEEASLLTGVVLALQGRAPDDELAVPSTAAA